MYEIRIVSGEEVGELRKAVFSAEQGYPGSKLFDEKESTADFLAVLLDGRAVGCGRFFKEGDGCFHIDNIALSRELRGGGYGRKLVEALVRECGKRGAAKVTVNAKTEAVGFYEKCGFTPCGSEFLDENFRRIPMVYKNS